MTMVELKSDDRELMHALISAMARHAAVTGTTPRSSLTRLALAALLLGRCMPPACQHETVSVEDAHEVINMNMTKGVAEAEAVIAMLKGETPPPGIKLS